MWPQYEFHAHNSLRRRIVVRAAAARCIAVRTMARKRHLFDVSALTSYAKEAESKLRKTNTNATCTYLGVANVLGPPDPQLEARHDSKVVFEWRRRRAEDEDQRREIEVRADQAKRIGVPMPRGWRLARTAQAAESIARITQVCCAAD